MGCPQPHQWTDCKHFENHAFMQSPKTTHPVRRFLSGTLTVGIGGCSGSYYPRPTLTFGYYALVPYRQRPQTFLRPIHSVNWVALSEIKKFQGSSRERLPMMGSKLQRRERYDQFAREIRQGNGGRCWTGYRTTRLTASEVAGRRSETSADV